MKVAVVTGGSSGIGAALARRLGDHGYHCVLVARGRERLERVAAELDAEADVCDVGDRAAVEALAARVGERHTALRLLVNNAGIPGRATFLDAGAELVEEVIRTNYLGGVWCLKAFLPLLEAGAPSTVVNVVSVAGTVSGGPSGPYTASKHAQIAFSRAITPELEARGIGVLTVNPGLTQTDGFPQDRFLRHRYARHTVVTAEKVADAIVDGLRHRRSEVFVPGYYRIASTLSALAPVTVARLASRRAPGA